MATKGRGSDRKSARAFGLWSWALSGNNRANRVAEGAGRRKRRHTSATFYGVFGESDDDDDDDDDSP